MRKLVITVGLATLVALATATPSPAADNSFDGNCSITGITVFGTPIGGQPQTDTYTFTTTPGKSTCSGTLNGKSVSNAPIEAFVTGSGTLSCAASQSGDPGKGYLDFTNGTPDSSDDTIINSTLSFVGAGTEVAIDIKGEKSGEAGGRASFLAYAADATSQCNANQLKQIGFDAMFKTFSPLTSAAPAAAPSSSSSSSSSSSGSSGSGDTSGGGSGSSGSPDQGAVAGEQFSGSSGNVCVVPKVVGMTLAKAKKALAKAHCGVGPVKKKSGAKLKGKKAKKGTVVAQKPAAGTKEHAGAKVALTVAA